MELFQVVDTASGGVPMLSICAGREEIELRVVSFGSNEMSVLINNKN